MHQAYAASTSALTMTSQPLSSAIEEKLKSKKSRKVSFTVYSYFLTFFSSLSHPFSPFFPPTGLLSLLKESQHIQLLPRMCHVCCPCLPLSKRRGFFSHHWLFACSMAWPLHERGRQGQALVLWDSWSAGWAQSLALAGGRLSFPKVPLGLHSPPILNHVT